MHLGSYDVMHLTETKITDEVYWKIRIRYDAMCSRATTTTYGGAQGEGGGGGLVTRKRPEGWDIESTNFHGPNVVIFEIVSGT